MANTTPLEQNISFFDSIKERRVPQISGIYLGTGWGLIQFIEWIVERYGLSPYLPDFSLVILFSLLPSVLIVAFFHGRPGPDNWSNVEKISIPVNLVATISLLFFLFSGKDLGAATTTMTVENENGTMVEKVIAKASFRKKIVLFNIKNNTGKTELDWLQTGLPLGISIDLMQDPFIDQTSSLTGNGMLSESVRKAGFPKGVDLPISLMQRISNDLHYDHFMSGNFQFDQNGNYILNTFLYQSKNGKLIKENQIATADPMAVIDQLTLTIKSDLGVPAYQTESLRDLPVKELISKNTDSNKHFVNGLELLVEKRNYKASAKALEKAVEGDQTFALAHLFLAVQYANENNSKQALVSIKKALKFDYKMPELFGFLAKEILYIMSGEAEKRLKLLKMQTELYPENVDGRNRLAQVYVADGLYAEAIAEYQKIQQLVNQPEIYADDIGYIYAQKNDLDTALTYMKKYASNFPMDTASFRNLAYVYGLMGNYELAKESTEKILFLDPEDLDAKLSLARLDIKSGDFNEAMAIFQSALEQSETPTDKVKILNQLAIISRLKGQPKKALSYQKLAHKELEKISPSLNLIIQQMIDIHYYVAAKANEEALQILKHAENTLQSPFENLPSLGYGIYYSHMEQPEKAAPHTIALDKTLQSVGSALQGLSSFNVQMKARVAELKGDYKSAIEGYKSYSQLKATDTTVSFLIGKALNLAGDLEAAEEYLLQHLKISPFSPRTHLELGKLYKKQSNAEKASEHLLIAREIWKEAEKGYPFAAETSNLLKLINK